MGEQPWSWISLIPSLLCLHIPPPKRPDSLPLSSQARLNLNVEVAPPPLWASLLLSLPPCLRWLCFQESSLGKERILCLSHPCCLFPPISAVTAWHHTEALQREKGCPDWSTKGWTTKIPSAAGGWKPLLLDGFFSLKPKKLLIQNWKKLLG